MTDKIKPEKLIGCFHCFKTSDLAIVPYIYGGKRVGLIFICKKCYPKLEDKALRVIVEPKNNT